MIRVGIGFDAHRFTANRELVLGGVKVPYQQGLDGWSDADVLLHAVIDALLGAAALGDMGQHFPPGNDKFKGISSMKLLEETLSLINSKGYEVANVDVVLILEEPKIGMYCKAMRQNIATALNIQDDHVGIKATTTEGLGFTGQKDGAAAQAVVLIRNKE